MSSKVASFGAVAEPMLAHGDTCTDVANAARFARDHAGLIRYSESHGWHVWNGTHFEQDETGERYRWARDTVKALFVEAQGDKKLAQWAASSSSRRGLENLLSLAMSEMGIVCRASAFDRNPYLLNTASGIVDLKTGRLSDHDPKAMITKFAPTFYQDADMPAPSWLTFLDEIMGHDLQMVEFLQRAVGYSLTGDTSEQVLFMPWGTGANGKSVFLQTLLRILGNYGINASPETFLSKPAGAISNDVARLQAARFVIAMETENDRRLAEALVKQVTGCDTVTARYLHREFFEFRPAFKIWLATNHKPRIVGTDYAIWRRVRLIPFDVTIAPEKRDPHLVEKLMAEAKGILAWAVQGCLLWQQRGLDPPQRVIAATEAYRDESDSLARFIADECVVGQGIQGRGLYHSYRTWAEANGFSPLNATTFSLRLQAKGFQASRDRIGRLFLGVGLAAEGEA